MGETKFDGYALSARLPFLPVALVRRMGGLRASTGRKPV